MNDDPIANALDSIKPKKTTWHYALAKVQNKFGEYEYLSADTEEEIESYCEGGVLGDELAIEEWCTNVTPIMVAKHFKWVGQARRNPFVIAKPIYINEVGEIDKWGNQKYVFKGYRNFKKKF